MSAIVLGSILGGRYKVTGEVTRTAEGDRVLEGEDQVLNRTVSLVVSHEGDAGKVAESARQLALGIIQSDIQVLDLGVNDDVTYVVTSHTPAEKLLDTMVRRDPMAAAPASVRDVGSDSPAAAPNTSSRDVPKATPGERPGEAPDSAGPAPLRRPRAAQSPALPQKDPSAPVKADADQKRPTGTPATTPRAQAPETPQGAVPAAEAGGLLSRLRKKISSGAGEDPGPAKAAPAVGAAAPAVSPAARAGQEESTTPATARIPSDRGLEKTEPAPSSEGSVSTEGAVSAEATVPPATGMAPPSDMDRKAADLKNPEREDAGRNWGTDGVPVGKAAPEKKGSAVPAAPARGGAAPRQEDATRVLPSAAAASVSTPNPDRDKASGAARQRRGPAPDGKAVDGPEPAARKDVRAAAPKASIVSAPVTQNAPQVKLERPANVSGEAIFDRAHYYEEEEPGKMPWLVLAVMGLIVVGALVASLMALTDLFPSSKNGAAPASPAASQPAPAPKVAPVAQDITRLAPPANPNFEAEGDGGLATLLDGDPATAWQTGSYASATFGGLSEYLALSVNLQESSDIGGFTITKPESQGGAFEIYVNDAPSLEGARKVGDGSLDGGNVEIDVVPDQKAKHLILKFTSIPTEGGAFRLRINEILVRD